MNMHPESSKPVVVCAFGLLAAFFMPWVQLFGYGMSGYNLGRLGSYGNYAWVIPILAGATILLSFSGTKNRAIGAIAGIVPLGAILYGLVRLGGEGGSDTTKGVLEMAGQVLSIGAWLTIIFSIAIIIAAKNANKKMASGAGININTNAPTQQPSTTQTVNPQRQVQQQYNPRVQQPQTRQPPSPSFNEQIAPVIKDIEKFVSKSREQIAPVIKGIGGFFSKNKMLLIGAAIVLIASFTVYKLFLKANPVADGRKAASFVCACQERHTDNVIAAYDNFLKGFSTNNFKSRRAALNKFEEAKGAEVQKLNQCLSEAQIKSNEMRSKYFTDRVELQQFDFTSSAVICNIPNEAKKNSLNAQIESKIREIKDPEPDIEKIKTDLIGQQIPGWRFEYLSEIQTATISNTTRVNDRIEFQLDLHLVGYRNPATDIHDAQLISTYIQGDQGWYFNNLKLIYITHSNTAPVNQWYKITPLKNCRYSILDQGHKYWVRDGYWGTKYLGGPDGGTAFNLTSSEVYIMSRESQSVDLVFKYFPNEKENQMAPTLDNSNTNYFKECDICGTYYGERYEGKECIKIEPNGAFMHYWRCDDARPANIGVWKISEKFIVLYLPKKEKEEQVFKDFFENKINFDDYYTHDHHDLRMEYGTMGTNEKYVKWNDRVYQMR